jgi:hypothetical protein
MSEPTPRQTGSHQRAGVYQALIRDLADRLDAEAMRRAKILEQLDLQGAAACRNIARKARTLGHRFDAWLEPESTFEQRKKDLDEYFEVIRAAQNEGVDLTG